MDGRIVVTRLAKHHGKLKAVDDLSFVVKPGRVTGFLGPKPIATYPESAAQWAGVVVMAGYVLAFAALGAFILRRRDIT